MSDGITERIDCDGDIEYHGWVLNFNLSGVNRGFERSKDSVYATKQEATQKLVMFFEQTIDKVFLDLNVKREYLNQLKKSVKNIENEKAATTNPLFGEVEIREKITKEFNKTREILKLRRELKRLEQL